MESLDEDIGEVGVTATDAADNLGNELESALFGGIIREREAGIGLNDADGGKVGEVKTFGETLGADEDVDFARFDGVIEGVKGGAFGVISVETSDFGSFEELF